MLVFEVFDDVLVLLGIREERIFVVCVDGGSNPEICE
jgi:hypothetical protein